MSLKRILVVDDEPAIRLWLTKALTLNGYAVETAGSGVEADSLVRSRHYDAIVCDIKMPNGDGRSLYRALLERDPSLARRTIFITGDTVNPTTSQFLSSHHCPSLAKPFAIQELVAAVEAVITAARATPCSSFGIGAEPGS
jgi:two-component system NtrC family sensor kinase